MQTADSLERIAYELAEDAAAEGVRYIEMRYSPVLNTRHDLSLGDTVEAPLRGIERAHRDHGIVSRLIICALRNLSPWNLDGARPARGGVQGPRRRRLRPRRRGARTPASVHASAFAHAREHGLACTCHAGEGAGADSVREAVYACGARRIGHATRLIEDACADGGSERAAHRARDLPDEQRADARRRLVRGAPVAPLLRRRHERRAEHR